MSLRLRLGLLGGLGLVLTLAIVLGWPTPAPLKDAETGSKPVAVGQPRVARDVKLSEPLPEEEEAPREERSDPSPEPAEVAVEDIEADASLPDEPAPTPEADALSDTRAPLLLLGEEVQPGTSARLSWKLNQRFEGIAVPTPVLVVHGPREGPTVCLTAAVHGDELNGIEIVRRVLYGLEPEALTGTVIGVPIVNLQGFRRASRYLNDRRDLNRFFPGNENGSSAARIAHSFFHNVVGHCNALVDIHTGSFQRTNLPQLRADMTVPEVAALSQGFGATSVLHNRGAPGTLRSAAVAAGIAAVTLETGEPVRLQESNIAHGVDGIQTLLTKLEMTGRARIWGEPEPVYYESTWVRADRGGLLFGDVKLGQVVREGDVLGTVTDPITNLRSELRAPLAGRVLGMALNQVVMPGFAAYRIGIRTTEGELANPEPSSLVGPEEGDPAVAPDPELEDENS
jgi:predicted deacylase